MSLRDTITIIEREIGLFSKSYKTIENGHTYDIPFDKKPAEQVLAALGGSKAPNALLSIATTPIKSTGNSDVVIKGFTSKTGNKELTLTGKRIDRLLKSNKIYVNSDLFPDGLYQTTMKKKVSGNRAADSPMKSQEFDWENLAVGVCHVQEIDLLVDTIKSSHDRAHTTVKEGKIEENAPALLLLSSPCLNLRSTFGSHFDLETQTHFIEGMFRNLFDATQKEGREYIAMTAAGLGTHGGKPEIYFAALMKIAKEFPKLNIIYHPGDYERTFDKELKKANLNNVARATKNVIFIADKLTRLGNLCALHIPATSDVLYGVSDIGGHWKSIYNEPYHSSRVGVLFYGKPRNETSQTYIGGLSTAPLNSFGFNPQAYTNIVERSLTRSLDLSLGKQSLNIDGIHSKSQVELEHESILEEHTVKVDKDAPEEKQTSTLTQTVDDKTNPPPVLIDDRTSKTPLPPDTLHSPVLDSSDVHQVSPPVVKEQSIEIISESPRKDASNKTSITCSLGQQGIFSPPSKTVTPPPPERITSSLNEEQVLEINRTIDRLTGEIQSCWPYPNKDLKQIKIEALNTLISNAHTMSIHDAIAAVKLEFPRAIEGKWSARTAKLFDKLEKSPSSASLEIG